MKPAPPYALVSVATLDNPAGRLYALLAEYDAAARTVVSLEMAWAKVLETEKRADIVNAMTEMAGLVAAVNRAVARQASGAIQEMCAYHTRQWASPFMGDLETQGQRPLVDSSAMLALNTVSELLSEKACEGVVPDDEERQSLREELLAVIEETKESAETPVEVRQLILERLYQIVWAIDHVHIGGPGAVTAAVERLAGSLFIAGADAAKSPPAKRSWGVVRKVWLAFRAGPAVLLALDAWPDVAERMLELGP